MAGGGDNGVLLGMTAANQARRSGGRASGGFGMFNVVPLLFFPIIAYVVTVMFAGGDPGSAEAMMNSSVFSIPLVSGPWAMKVGDLIVIFSLGMLFIELVKSAGTGTATIINHGLSMLVFVIALVLFLLWGRAGTSTFFLITVMALMDTVAGFVVTIVAARRDLAVADG